MNKIEIWDKESDLKGLSKEIWIENYPETENKTLVLVDDSLVLWLEDLKQEGYTGVNDKAVVEAYLTKQAEIINAIATNGAKLKTEVASGGLSIFLNDDWKIRWMDDGSLRREYIPTKTQSATNQP